MKHVECVRNHGTSKYFDVFRNLTIGKIYTVFNTSGNLYTIIDDSGNYAVYPNCMGLLKVVYNPSNNYTFKPIAKSNNFLYKRVKSSRNRNYNNSL